MVPKGSRGSELGGKGKVEEGVSFKEGVPVDGTSHGNSCVMTAAMGASHDFDVPPGTPSSCNAPLSAVLTQPHHAAFHRTPASMEYL